MSELENSIFVKVFRPISEESGGGLQPPSPMAARSLRCAPMTKPSHLPNNLSDNTFSENSRKHTPFHFDFRFISDLSSVCLVKVWAKC